MIKIKPLTDVSIDEIHQAFSNAFSDYVEPFDLTKEQLQYMLERRGCDLTISFGAFFENNIVGFTLNGTGNWNGLNTAYDTGTGVVKKFRKQGIASKIFNESLPNLRDAGIKQYLLEVIKTNKAAVELYKKAGFNITREFDYYTATKSSINFEIKSSHHNVIIKNLENPNWEELKTFWDFSPSWQNSIESVSRKLKYFRIFGAYTGGELVGYGIIEEHTGDIPQIAISKNYRNLGIGKRLLREMINKTSSEGIKFINAEISNESFKQFAKSIGLKPGHGQYEMILPL